MTGYQQTQRCSFRSAFIQRVQIIALLFMLSFSLSLASSEHLLGYTHGAEPLPEKALELDLTLTHRSGKDVGSYNAVDYDVEIEYGATSRLTVGVGLKAQSINTSGIIISGYLPEEISTGIELSGFEVGASYNMLSAAKDDLGLSVSWGLEYSWIDMHSGQEKDTISVEIGLALQKYYLDGQAIWMSNFGLESTIADRGEINGLDPAIEWPTDPEVEIEVKMSTGFSYRFKPGWFIGAEILYETEYETEVAQERWSIFAGPSLHYANQRYWMTVTILPQILGGGEKYDDQDKDMHLIEKSETEMRFRFGYNF